MSDLDCIIIDDERLARRELRAMLLPFPGVRVVAEAANADEGLQLIRRHQPHFILLDIQMPGKTGFEMLEELAVAPRVIFTTAYDQYAIKAFELNAFDYLLKPFSEKRLQQAIDKIRPAADPTAGPLPDQIFLKDGNKCYFVQVEKIERIEALGNYVQVFFEGRKAVVKRSLSEVEERLDPARFFRANRAAIINLRHIDAVHSLPRGKLSVVLHSQKEIVLSERKSVEFKSRLSL